MSGLQEVAQWENQIYRIEESDPVEGGENGVDNRSAKQLANRTLWLKQQQESEQQTRAQAIQGLNQGLSAESQTRGQEIQSLQQGLSNEVQARQQALISEAQSRTQSVDSLQQQLNQIVALIQNKQWPIGSVYENEIDGRNPSHADLLGFGTWIPTQLGRVSVGVDSTQPDFDHIGKTGGATTVQLTADQNGQHSHDIDDITPESTAFNAGGGSEHRTNGAGNQQGMTTKDSGLGEAHNNLQPYVVSAKWRRTA